MKNISAGIGAIVLTLFLLGSVGLGHFTFMFTDAKYTCTKVTP